MRTKQLLTILTETTSDDAIVSHEPTPDVHAADLDRVWS
jgi:hypothetical protein